MYPDVSAARTEHNPGERRARRRQAEGKADMIRNAESLVHGHTGSNATDVLNNYINQLPLSRGGAVTTECMGTVKPSDPTVDPIYCDNTIVPKNYVEPVSETN